MIEVLKKGTPYNDQDFQLFCRLCKASLKFKGSEVQQAIDFNYIVCPECKTWNNIDKAKPYV